MIILLDLKSIEILAKEGLVFYLASIFKDLEKTQIFILFFFLQREHSSEANKPLNLSSSSGNIESKYHWCDHFCAAP